MNEQKHEILSALMDGELETGHAEIIGTMIRDESLRGTWWRYHFISDCLRGTLPDRLDRLLPERISRALHEQPTLLAPGTSAARSLLRPAAGFAIAASVAALAILGIQHQRDDSAMDAATTVAAVQPATATAPAVRTLTLASGRSGPIAARPSIQPGYAGARLNRYLVNYNEYRSNAALQGLFPYVRIVAHDQDQ